MDSARCLTQNEMSNPYNASRSPMTYEGDFASSAGRFALVAARFNGFIDDQLSTGAIDALQRHGVTDDRIDLVKVPGSFEIPVIAQKLGKSGKYAAVICLGCIIRGDTDHYDHVAGAATSGIATAAGARIIQEQGSGTATFTAAGGTSVLLDGPNDFTGNVAITGAGVTTIDFRNADLLAKLSRLSVPSLQGSAT